MDRFALGGANNRGDEDDDHDASSFALKQLSPQVSKELKDSYTSKFNHFVVSNLIKLKEKMLLTFLLFRYTSDISVICLFYKYGNNGTFD